MLLVFVLDSKLTRSFRLRIYSQDLEIGGFHVAKGTMLIPLLAEIHMDPKHYDDPEQYRPNRFIEETTGQLIRPASFMPFQAGELSNNSK